MTSRILGSGSHLPEKVVTNEDLAKLFTTSDTWIKEKIGIKERRYAADGQGVSDLALEASKNALTQANLKADDIDAIVFATATPEYHAPGSGTLLQDKLSCRNIPAFDVRNTSPGFLFSLDIADGLIATGRYNTVLVAGSEVHSTGLDYSDQGRMMSVIFGDGAASFILGKSTDSSGFKSFSLHTEGSHFDKLWCPLPSSLKKGRVSEQDVKDNLLAPTMDGRYVFQHAVKFMTEAIKEVLLKNKISIGDIDLVISHQANMRIIEEIGKNLNLTTDQVASNIEIYGNTSSASIPILYDELNRSGKMKPGQKIIFCSFGSGFCWGAALYEV